MDLLRLQEKGLGSSLRAQNKYRLAEVQRTFEDMLE